MSSKKCFKCEVEKPLTDFYKHKDMSDGHLNKCKSCTKNDTKQREDILRNDLDWVEKEKARGREKYHRLNYKDIHKPSSESKKIIIKKYKESYPEKKKAKSILGKKLVIEGFERHHWSYNEEHYCDIIYLTTREHAKVHRFLIYDQDYFMYRRLDTNDLLDTKEKHESYIRYCIDNYED